MVLTRLGRPFIIHWLGRRVLCRGLLGFLCRNHHFLRCRITLLPGSRLVKIVRFRRHVICQYRPDQWSRPCKKRYACYTF
jgi:hypothetical protein